MENKKDLYNNSKKEHRLGWEIIYTILAAALFLSIYTFILQNNYKKSVLESAVDRNEKCADAIHALMSNKFTKDDFNGYSNAYFRWLLCYSKNKKNE